MKEGDNIPNQGQANRIETKAYSAVDQIDNNNPNFCDVQCHCNLIDPN